MTAPTPAPHESLTQWLETQPCWLQHAAADLIAGHANSPCIEIRYADMAKREAAGTPIRLEAPVSLAGLETAAGDSVSLVSLSDISGIGQLAPRSPLRFGPENIQVVFGSNGSGKSSYVRILKHACGARHKGELLPNVFNEARAPQQCTITIKSGASESPLVWEATTGELPALTSIDIFDTQCGQSYLVQPGEASYEPRALDFLSALARVSNAVSAQLGIEIRNKAKTLPSLPPEHASTNVGRWFFALGARVTPDEIETNCSWTPADQAELENLSSYLAEKSPRDRAQEFQRKKAVLNNLCRDIRAHLAAFSDEACARLVALRRAAHDTQQTAELAAKANLKDAALEGVGTKQWLDLWQIARAFSENEAYPFDHFPHVGDGARCVLCHQELGPEAKGRLNSFDNYVKNEAATLARRAKEELETAIRSLPALPTDPVLTATASGAGLTAENAEILRGFYVLLEARRQQITSDSFPEEFGAYPDANTWLNAAEVQAHAHEAQARQFIEGFNEAERSLRATRHKELTARKWISAQKIAVEAEVRRANEIALLESARGLCNTRSISLKKGALAEQLITPAYVAAFNAELSRLGARRISVVLEHTKVERGAVMHQVRLNRATTPKPLQEVLSEGEHRIVCLAAFLADVATKPNNSTFVFDDPISSLDLDYEEAVVQRLVDLSRTRQVIVFTHRLSLLGMLQDYAKKRDLGCRVVHLCRETWGAGNPGDETIEIAKPKATLNQHLPNRIREAKTVLEADGAASYRVRAQSICTETRKLIERLIEIELLGDVIQRHRRAINTQGKLEKLADISAEDCAFLDEMMTKYSRYEHAQSAEAPVELPEPEELSADVARLKAWRDALEQRRA
jgi:energy-coupling factor transporter ATP-binding protein EcfA2